jgi:hypothetical protein
VIAHHSPVHGTVSISASAPAWSIPAIMVVLFGLSLLSLLFRDVAASHAIPSDCRNPQSDKDACAQPIEDVIAVTPRTFYAAKIRCYDCPYYGWVDEPPRIGSSRELMFGDQDLVSGVYCSIWAQLTHLRCTAVL